MSVEISTFVWRLELPATEKLLMLAFADHANDEDRTCWPSLTHLAKKTGLDRATVWKVIERLIVSGLISRVGQHGQNTRYRINHRVVADNNQLPSTTSCPAQIEVVAHGNKVVAHGNPKSSITITQPSKKNVGTVVPQFSQDDLNTANSILADILSLNPNHKHPNVHAWAKTIRIMRERDKRPLQEIQALWRWAHGHSFWRTNILSPDKLRQQWDKLVIQRDHGGRNETKQRPVSVKEFPRD